MWADLKNFIARAPSSTLSIRRQYIDLKAINEISVTTMPFWFFKVAKTVDVEHEGCCCEKTSAHWTAGKELQSYGRWQECKGFLRDIGFSEEGMMSIRVEG